MSTKRPFIVIVPGASQSAAHYGYLSHLFFQAGYPVFSATLPSVGVTGNVSAEDDAKYVRDNMLIPVLDVEERDAIMLMHSYSSVPGSAAAKGLSPSERKAEGKMTAVIGQIYLSSLLTKGGDGVDVKGAFGGQFPPHVRPEVSTPAFFNTILMLTCYRSAGEKSSSLRRPNPAIVSRCSRGVKGSRCSVCHIAVHGVFYISLSTCFLG